MTQSQAKTASGLRQQLIDQLKTAGGWSSTCDEIAKAYVCWLFENGESVKSVRSELAKLGLSKKGAREVIKESGSSCSGEDSSWGLAKIKRHRTIYHVLFLIQFGLTLCAAFSGYGVFAIFGILIWFVFLLYFSRIAILLLSHTVGSMIVISFFLTIIPFINLLIVAIIDRRIWRELHRRYG